MTNVHNSVHHFIAGWGAGVFGILVGYPMDTIKTYQQMSDIKLTTRQATKLIIKKDGLQGMYKGMLFPLLCSGYLNSIYFGVYDCSLNLLQSIHGNKSISPTNNRWMQDLFIAGSIGGASQAFISCPSELIKIRIQIGKEYSSSYHAVLNIHRKYGIRGFFVGFLPTILRDAIHGGFYIFSYQCVRHYMFGELNLEPGVFETLVAGGIAGIVSWIPVIPFDTIKSRIQADNLQNPIYKGMIDCSINLYKKFKFYGFFKGFTMITIRSVPVNVSIMYGYEVILWFCKHLYIFGL